MKKQILIIVSIISIVLLMTACDNFNTGKAKLNDNRDSLSYAIGFLYGKDLVSTEYDFDFKLVLKGMESAQDPNYSPFSEDELTELIGSLQEQVANKKTEQQEATKALNQSAGKLFMEENAKAEGVISRDSGLQYKVIKSGEGKQVKATDTVKTHYVGKFLDGEIFDSSRQRGEPAEFEAGMVIEGWSEGLTLMREGDIFEFYIPDSLAYGEQGYSIIEPGSYLIFEVELLEIVSE
ncbi:MAG: FKBP-type peptidyl-prolyl cis-trans isomerase [Candidatus Cloacimonetes bacterium]|nr:FKBP-type peptidyl-prolyl cis-trans isomerase [Candidatus Cloacimonadota bacterium]MDD4155694.1 FKBP-type peptidyl-prolyl cis-trans isomerase [Candidatus Cloacimonadota bacterium]